MSAQRGRRMDTLPAARPVAPAPTVYAVGLRPLRFGHYILPAGTEVPDASTWPRVEAWARSRHIVEVKDGQPYLSFAEFAKRIDDALIEAEDMIIAAGGTLEAPDPKE